jgi:hypothetical protein
MKLDRNINANGTGKYALLLLRKVEFDEGAEPDKEVLAAIDLLDKRGVLDWGHEFSAREFFVIRLKDKYAGAALSRYAAVAASDDPEYAQEVAGLANRAGERSPYCKKPD